MDLEKVRQGASKNMEETIKINLGSGQDYRKGYINIDDGKMFVDSREDVICDIKNYPKDNSIADNSVDEILLSHVVMYFRPEELQPLLIRWRTWLKEGGQLIIETSDLKKLLKIVLEESNPWVVNNYGLVNIFGTNKTGPHRWGWMPDKLITELYRAGFKKIAYKKGEKKPNRDYKLIATK